MNEIEENIFQKDTFPKVGGLYEGHKFESTFLSRNRRSLSRDKDITRTHTVCSIEDNDNEQLFLTFELFETSALKEDSKSNDRVKNDKYW